MKTRSNFLQGIIGKLWCSLCKNNTSESSGLFWNLANEIKVENFEFWKWASWKKKDEKKDEKLALAESVV
jgi:hypothetical protein